MVGRPEVLLLDEPLRSLDPEERSALLRAVPQRTTVLLASRLPASETGIVNQVVLLRAGRLALHARVTELERRGLPLSMRGLEALAGLAHAARPARRDAGRGLAPPSERQPTLARLVALELWTSFRLLAASPAARQRRIALLVAAVRRSPRGPLVAAPRRRGVVRHGAGDGLAGVAGVVGAALAGDRRAASAAGW